MARLNGETRLVFKCFNFRLEHLELFTLALYKAVREEGLFTNTFWRQQIGILTLARSSS